MQGIKESSRHEFKLIDLVKFVCAIFVVGIHTLGFQTSDNDLCVKVCNNLFGLAVPFFFVSSGFLIAQKILVKKYGGSFDLKTVRGGQRIV